MRGTFWSPEKERIRMVFAIDGLVKKMRKARTRNSRCGYYFGEDEAKASIQSDPFPLRKPLLTLNCLAFGFSCVVISMHVSHLL